MHYVAPITWNVRASPNGCQSLRVTWTPPSITSPLTLIHYRVMYRPQGGSSLSTTTNAQGSYLLTDLVHATTYTVTVEARTQVGYGYYSTPGTATTLNGKASTVCMYVKGHMLFATPLAKW